METRLKNLTSDIKDLTSGHINNLTSDIREFTHVRRQRQDDGYQYNIINPIAQKK